MGGGGGMMADTQAGAGPGWPGLMMSLLSSRHILINSVTKLLSPSVTPGGVE